MSEILYSIRQLLEVGRQYILMSCDKVITREKDSGRMRALEGWTFAHQGETIIECYYAWTQAVDHMFRACRRQRRE